MRMHDEQCRGRLKHSTSSGLLRRSAHQPSCAFVNNIDCKTVHLYSRDSVDFVEFLNSFQTVRKQNVHARSLLYTNITTTSTQESQNGASQPSPGSSGHHGEGPRGGTTGTVLWLLVARKAGAGSQRDGSPAPRGLPLSVNRAGPENRPCGPSRTAQKDVSPRYKMYRGDTSQVIHVQKYRPDPSLLVPGGFPRILYSVNRAVE